MDYEAGHRFLGFLMLGAIGLCTLTSCTTTSNLSATSNKAAAAAAATPHAVPVTTETITINGTGESANAAASPTIVGIPAPPASPSPVDQVAQPKPSSEPASSPVILASVPRTPVANRPTNQIMMVRTTAYTHTEADHLQYGRKNAVGTTLQYGSKVRSAAADWSKYPLGTRFMIEGLPYEYVVDDYGSALVGTETIDIYKPEKSSMGDWGVRNVPIKVIEWGSFEESRKILDGRKHVRHADHVREMLQEIEKKGRNGSISLAPTGTSA